ncbi:hypothetical protein LTS08_005022 [Lithohypha guttulata]|nr:hypothetical protein LTS08_005022 [Lithohypha guttulata]
MSITNGVLTILPPPEGYIVDFDSPARNGNIAGYWITGIGIVLSTSVLAIRMYTKVFIIKDFSLDDATLLASYVFGIAVQSILTREYPPLPVGWLLKLADFWVVEASGVHAWEMPIARYQHFSTVIMVASVLYVPCLGFAKFSILSLYRKISQLKWFNVCIYILMTIIVCYSIGIIFALIFPCQPIPANWDLSVSGKCIDKAAIYLATAAVNVITDFLILTLPLPMVLRLHMPRGKKIGLVILFVVGSA